MKNLQPSAALAGLLSLGVLPAQGAYTYVDGVDGTNHPDAPGGTNLFLDTTSPGTAMTTDLGDGTANWRYRNTGPGAPAAGTSAYMGRASDGDPDIYHGITGLAPLADYNVRLYGVWSTSNTSWGLSYSFDGGGSWSSNISSAEIVAVDGIDGQGWVDALGDPVGSPSGDTRGNLIIGTAQTDATGRLLVGIRASGSDRGVYDGIAYELVPEPTSLAMTGLGVLFLLGRRRR